MFLSHRLNKRKTIYLNNSNKLIIILSCFQSSIVLIYSTCFNGQLCMFPFGSFFYSLVVLVTLITISGMNGCGHRATKHLFGSLYICVENQRGIHSYVACRPSGAHSSPDQNMVDWRLTSVMDIWKLIPWARGDPFVLDSDFISLSH